jgi:hypothetical protein
MEMRVRLRMREDKGGSVDEHVDTDTDEGIRGQWAKGAAGLG